MALATVIIRETNLVGADITTLTSSNMGILDTPNTTLATAYAIPADSYSYEKWQRLQVSANASGNTIQGIRVWRTGSLGGGSDTHLTNARTGSYAGAASYSTPLLTVSSYTQTMPTSDPGATNLGIGGTLTPTSNGVGLISTTGYSDYLVHQIHVHSSTTAGPAAANTLYIQYDEYA
jgi:hypothetical protein